MMIMRSQSRLPSLSVIYRHLSQQTSSNSKRRPFKVLNDTAVDKDSKEFARNTECYNESEQRYKLLLGVALSGGSEKAKARHAQQKKLLATDRLKQMLDKDTADEFLELSPLCGMAMEYGDIPRAGLITGIGRVNGVHCVLIVNDATVKGGTIFPVAVKKQLRAQEIAMMNRLPCVYVVDSGGAFLPLQAEIFPDKEHGGKTFGNEAILNSLNIPQLAVVVGSCTAGGAYVPTMAQENVIVHKVGTIFLGGPPLVYAALGEIISAEKLGGATMHSSTSGCTDHFAETEEEGFQLGRDIVTTFNIPEQDEPSNYEEPLFDPTELPGCIPSTGQHTMDMYKVIARVVDGSRFQEFKAMYGSNIITGFAHIQGYLVGILGNSGIITTDAASKGAHFVQLCSQRKIPLIFLQNTTPDMTDVTTAKEGNLDSFWATFTFEKTFQSKIFQPSRNKVLITESDAERHSAAELLGIRLRHQARFMSAVACAQVPKLTVIVGNSFGCDNYMMAGKSMDPRFLFMWPNAQIGMESLDQMIEKAIKIQFPTGADKSSDAYEKFEAKITERLKLMTSSMYSSSRLWDDGIILPQHTRQILGQCLRIVHQAGSFNEMTSPVIRL